ncbi:hypothetical protein Hanom_Chr12g01133671 [Helianthus anomalus]
MFYKDDVLRCLYMQRVVSRQSSSSAQKELALDHHPTRRSCIGGQKDELLLTGS